MSNRFPQWGPIVMGLGFGADCIRGRRAPIDRVVPETGLPATVEQPAGKRHRQKMRKKALKAAGRGEGTE